MESGSQNDWPESLPQQVRRHLRIARLLFLKHLEVLAPIAWAAAILIAPIVVNRICDAVGGIDAFQYHVGWVIWGLIVFTEGAAWAVPDAAVIWAVFAPLSMRWRISSSLPFVLVGYLMNGEDHPGWFLLSSMLCWLIVVFLLQPARSWFRGSLRHRRFQSSGGDRGSFRILHLLKITLAVAVTFAVIRWYDDWRDVDPLVEASYSEGGLMDWMVGTFAYMLYILLFVLPITMVAFRTTPLRVAVARVVLLVTLVSAVATFLFIEMGWYLAYPDSVFASALYLSCQSVGGLGAIASFAFTLRWAGYRLTRSPSAG